MEKDQGHLSEQMHQQVHSPELVELIRENLTYQNEQSIKRTLFKESLVKISLDQEFDDLFDHVQPTQTAKFEVKKFIEVSQQVKKICLWLQQTQQNKGMAYIPLQSTPKLFHLLHQKVKNTVIIITEYQSYWINKMEEISRLSKVKWAFLNSNLKKHEKVKILELYELQKTKLFFISPSLLKDQDFHEFECDLLVFQDLHLYQNEPQFIEKMAERCSPKRILGLYSTQLFDTYTESKFKLKKIPMPSEIKNSCICLKTTSQQKLKTMLNYIQKHEVKKTLVIVNSKNEARQLAKSLKLKPLTSLNLVQLLNGNQFLYQQSQVIKGLKDEEKLFNLIRKSESYSITISKYFDALRFGEYDSIIFYSFTDVPKFMESSPDISHRLLLLVDDDYHIVRNSITSDHLTTVNLMKIVMKIMQKPRKLESNTVKRYFSGVTDDEGLDRYSVFKEYVEKDQEKIIKINSFCKTHEISLKVINRVVDGLEKSKILKNICRVISQIKIEDESLLAFRNKFPTIPEIRKRVNILNYSTSVKRPTKIILEEIKESEIDFKVTEEVLQLKILQNYEDVDWRILETIVNQNIFQTVKDLDRSYIICKNCSYGSIELTKREKYLQRSKQLLNFYKSSQTPGLSNMFKRFHKSNLLTSEIEQWLRHSQEGLKDEHDLVLILQGVENVKSIRFREDAIFGRYRRVKYQDLLQVVRKIRKHKKVKIDE